MSAKRYVGPEKGAALLGVKPARWRQLRAEHPGVFPDHLVEIGDPIDPASAKRRPKRGYSPDHIERYKQWRMGDGPPPPRRQGPPARYASAQWLAEQLDRSKQRIAQLREEPGFPVYAVIIEDPDGETYGWNPSEANAYIEARRQHPPRPGRPAGRLTQSSPDPDEGERTTV